MYFLSSKPYIPLIDIEFADNLKKAFELKTENGGKLQVMFNSIKLKLVSYFSKSVLQKPQ